MNEITNSQNIKTKRSSGEKVIDDYFANLALRVSSGELSKSSSETYTVALNSFLSWMKDNPSSNQFSSDTIREWIASMREKEYASNTIAIRLSGVKSFFRWARKNEYITNDPTEDIKGPKRKGANKNHKRDILTNTEMIKLLAAPDTSKREGIRDRAILHLMAYTAIRSIEVHRANFEDIRTEQGRTVLYIQGKGRQEADEKVVIAHPDAQSALHDWLAIRNKPIWKGTTPLFISFSKRSMGKRLSGRAIRYLVKSYFNQIGVIGDRKTTHSIRHTAITNAIQNGADPILVRDMARHASIDTTMIYYHTINRLKNPAEDLIDY